VNTLFLDIFQIDTGIYQRFNFEKTTELKENPFSIIVRLTELLSPLHLSLVEPPEEERNPQRRKLLAQDSKKE
jgi:hypothetical protein